MRTMRITKVSAALALFVGGVAFVGACGDSDSQGDSTPAAGAGGAPTGGRAATGGSNETGKGGSSAGGASSGGVVGRGGAGGSSGGSTPSGGASGSAGAPSGAGGEAGGNAEGGVSGAGEAGATSGGSGGAPPGGSGGENVGGEAGAGGAGSGTPPSCELTCEQASDCVRESANPPFDADNWVCDAGHCRWLGCLDDDECAFFGGVCRQGFTGVPGVMACTEGCNNAADVCFEAGRPIADDDNWTCEDGGCRWLGCNDDDECIEELGQGSRCANDDPAAFPNCVTGCTVPADCVAMGSDVAHDADNFACENGECVPLGCVSDEECEEAAGMPSECVEGGP